MAVFVVVVVVCLFVFFLGLVRFPKKNLSISRLEHIYLAAHVQGAKWRKRKKAFNI